MSKKEEFKNFASSHPELAKRVKSGDATWQSLYELYDIYGSSDDVWDEYLKKDDGKSESISKLIKNIDMDSIQKHINTAQKALGFISELTSKSGSEVAEVIKGPVTPRPINKFFGD